MGLDIGAGEIGDEALVAILLDIEDQRALSRLFLVAEAARAEEDAEFERHVEAGQAIDRIELGAREIVDAVPAFLDQAVELVDAGLAAIVELAGRASLEAAGMDGEDQRLEDRCIIRVERAVDEDVVGRQAGAGRQIICGPGLA